LTPQTGAAGPPTSQPSGGLKSLLKTLLPAFAVSIARDCEGLPPVLAFTYLRLRATRGFRLRSDRPKLRRRPRSILFVCHGNVMRSPLAAELFRARMGADSGLFAVESAGTWTTNGRPADPRALAAGDKLGVSLSTHRSRLLTPQMVSRNELICVMDHRNEAEVVGRFPRAARKTILLGGLERGPGDSPSIDDPYSRGPEQAAIIYARLAASVDALVARLRPR
jgi:protein-tyrosine-phosphatase